MTPLEGNLGELLGHLRAPPHLQMASHTFLLSLPTKGFRLLGVGGGLSPVHTKNGKRGMKTKGILRKDLGILVPVNSDHIAVCTAKLH